MASKANCFEGRKFVKNVYIALDLGELKNSNKRRWPKSKWIDGVEADARILGCSNWLPDAQYRGRWRHLLEEAKYHPGAVETTTIIIIIIIIIIIMSLVTSLFFLAILLNQR
jgi:hypothetical protein